MPSIEPAGTVVRVFIRRADHILLVMSRRTVVANEWELPGGQVEEGETPLEAAERELQEETSLSLGETRKLVDWYRETPHGTHWRYVVYEALNVMGTSRINDPEEIYAINYFHQRQLPQLDEHTTTLFRKFRTEFVL